MNNATRGPLKLFFLRFLKSVPGTFFPDSKATCPELRKIYRMPTMIPMGRLIKKQIQGIMTAALICAAWPLFAQAGPDPCTEQDGVVTCTGDQSEGISSASDFSSPPATTLEVYGLSSPIQPYTSVSGIYFKNDQGDNVIINSGTGAEAVSIVTTGADASGIAGIAVGNPQSAGDPDPFLGVPLVGEDPAVAGGRVEINSFSDIETEGDRAHGIYAYSASGGYPDSVIEALEAFDENDFSFEVTEVRDSGNFAAAFDAEGNAEVRGYLIDENGNPVTDADGNVMEHGTFVIGTDGTYSLSFNEGEIDQLLEEYGPCALSANYTVEGRGEGDSRTEDGRLIVVLQRDGDGSLEEISVAQFESFGLSTNPGDETNPTVFPDLQGYVDGLLAKATGGGAGGTITVNSNDSIETRGECSHGIHAYSIGGKGGPGTDSTFYLFWESRPTEGGDGESPGNIDITANGRIVTSQDKSSGISAVSAGGEGGAGGDGVAYRDGRRGGTGGDGGVVAVSGNADIETQGDYASGILALSVGGNGGAGGSTGGAMSGGNGGYGGRGGIVDVSGSWDITTAGDKSHGIWAKSLGGNAGAGGSGGWLFGDPGWGGQATDGGSVTLHSSGDIATSGLTAYGLYAQSVGGFGGDGGTSSGLFWSFGGNAESGGSGGSVEAVNLAGGSVITTGDHSHAILAQSIGGGGGSGGGEFGLFASLGGEGASGGFGGDVSVENDGLLETSGTRAYGIFAQSVGGGGGDGGSVGGLVAIGGRGSQTSHGGNVEVINRGRIHTGGGIDSTGGADSHAIFAQSIGGGGGDGGRSSGLISIGGDGGGGGDAGSVSVTNEGILHTGKNDSYGIFAQSIGGGGGSGGGAVSTGVSIGGTGDFGGDGGNVEIYGLEGSSITTEGDRSHGVLAESVGGGGGSGGFAITAGGGMSVAIGGDGAVGGDAGLVDIFMDGAIITSGEEAYGIFAQSVGGGGGNGGFSIAGNIGGGLSLALGGGGSGGGIGKDVNVGIESDPIAGTIFTSGLRSHGILAQSLGGGGGDGGFSIAATIGGNTSANLSFGGQGGEGNQGGDVNVSSVSTITTQNHEAHGIFAQSVGGSGGSGGFSIAGSIGGGTSLNLAFGGEGGNGSSAGSVTVGSETSPGNGAITTHGDRSYGILAQSVGGGGGAGGSAISGALMGPAAISMGFGGDGGTGGLGDAVDVANAGSINTRGEQSHGIFAQSVGGGGGDGGLSIAGGVTAFGGLSLAMGGDGGGGNHAGDVSVLNSGNVVTRGEYAYGILAQSVGGGGGTGGSSGSVMVNFSSLVPIPEPYPTGSVNISASLGGEGGEGGLAGIVDVDNTGGILTAGDHAYGIFAQSVGGGGGDGGKAVAATANISMPEGIDSSDTAAQSKQVSVEVDFAMALGGNGADGNSGNEVDVFNSGTIDTAGVGAHGIFAQSVGGGGGSGGDARSMILSIDPSNWVPAEGPPDPTSFSVGATMSLGGSGGAASHGGTVVVENQGGIITNGADAFGILAQSVGGGGGVGGSGYHGLDLADFGVSEEYAQYQDLLPVQDDSDLDITLGGTGGSGGDGNDVDVTNTGEINTFGAGALAILAQSIGGGGGLAGVGATGGDGSVGLGGNGGLGGGGGNVAVDLSGSIHTRGVAAHGIFAQSVGGGGGYAGNIDRGVTDFGINFAMGGNGGDAGNGGDIFSTSEGDIITEGDAAIGVFAQSVGGGGGLGGEVGFGFGFAGSVGGAGDGGRVEVDHSGNITTYGDNAHGIFAQSVGGQDYGGDVVVTVSGDITVHGEGALPVIAQSEGTAGRRNIDINYAGGTITGGSASAVSLLGGIDNTFTNHGVITTAAGISGTAVSATSGNDTVHNHGTIIGSIDLEEDVNEEGVNALRNHPEGIFESGPTLHLGPGNTFTNEGTFSPGGSGAPVTTILGSNLVQSASGTFLAEVYRNGESDKLLLTDGSASLDGTLQVGSETGLYYDGTTYRIIETQGGEEISGSFSSLVVPARKPLLGFDVNQRDHSVEVAVDAPSNKTVATNRVESATADYLDRITPSASGDLLDVLGEFQSLSSSEFSEAFSSLSPDSYESGAKTTYRIGREFTGVVQQRMGTVRSYLHAQGATRNEPVLLAYNGSLSDLGRLYSSADLSQVQGEAGFWFNAFGNWGDQDAENGYTGYDYFSRGGALGFDGLTDNLIVGLSAGLSRADLDFDRNRGESRVDNFSGAFYGSYFTKRFYLEGSFSYGMNRYDNKRNVSVGSISATAESEHEGDLFSADFGGNYMFDAGKWQAGPYGSIAYSYLREDGFIETGAGGINLIMEKTSTNALVSELGMRAFRVVYLKNGYIMPELRAAWSYDFDIDDRMIRASYAGSPGASFSIKGPDVKKHGAVLGTGFTYGSQRGLSTSIQYRGEFREKYVSHGILGEIRFTF